MLLCKICGNKHNLTSEFLNELVCDRCGSAIDLKDGHSLEESIPILGIGESVKICNREHAWFDEIGLIIGKKHKHYRIEVLGKRIWMPEDWVKHYDTDSTT